MSRIGKLPVSIPQGVTVKVQKNSVEVQGPKGQLSQTFPPEIDIQQEEGGQVVLTRHSEHRTHKAKHGLVRALINNMVLGVSRGFKRQLYIEGVGYKAVLHDKNLELSLGYSHPVIFEPPAGISFEVDKTGREVGILGIDKELVGEIAARVRRSRGPEPYKGKGIRYIDEKIRRKAGKAGKAK
jgi:large subunit ribosomal protein L6